MAAMPIVVVGGGGHAKVVLDALRLDTRFSIAGLVDPAGIGGTVLGFPVLGGDEILPKLKLEGIAAAFVAIGDNRRRLKLGGELQRLGFALPAIVHPTAIVSPHARIEDGAIVMAGAMIGPDARIGAFAIVNTGAIVEHDVRIGTAAHIAPGCALAGCVAVGARSLIGVGSVARPEIRIGDDVVAGAGSVIVADIADGEIVAGVPARSLMKQGQPKRGIDDFAA